MKIGELAKRSGMAASRIRFYEASGLLHAVSRLRNGYREYPEDALLVLGIISQAQKSGFSLEELRALIPADLSAWRHDDVIEAMQRKVAEIEAQERQLAAGKSRLLGLIDEIRGKPDHMDCATSARSVLQRLRAQESAGARAS